MLLSIVMMIKNEEKNLDRTLRALNPLRNEIDTELIIVDTGSTDNSIEISKKYTDKIYYEKWNNDFAKMRNISISKAKGEWILILDADEELLEYNKIIEFYNSDLCKKYNSASIVIKNISSEEDESYSEGHLIRLFRNDSDFRYEGAIHEQPIYKNPIYNNIATFNHYGYMFNDEEFKQKKIKRNEEILIKELKNNPKDPYINYQLSKNYICDRSYEEAIYHMEESFSLYKNNGSIPIFVQTELARLYLNLNKYEKCEKLCLKYIKHDNKNIDIYYYLAKSQILLRKFDDSLKNYKRYLYLIDNYDITTQVNNITCEGNTVCLSYDAYIDIINIYYLQEMYEEVILNIKYVKKEKLKSIYFIIIESLYKLEKYEDIVTMCNTLSSEVEKKEMILAIEKLILNIKKSDRKKLFLHLENINGNYGIFNKIRLGKNKNIQEYNRILKEESNPCYGEMIYRFIDKDITNILNNVSYLNIKNYIDFMVINKRECILSLYDYIMNSKNTLNIEKIKIYSCISNSLLKYGNLNGQRYENIFLMYITYRYEYLKKIHNPSLKEDELIQYIQDKDDKFIVEIMKIIKYKKTDNLTYIRNIKKLLIENQEYKKAINILISKFESELQESEELVNLKSQYKNIIEKELSIGNLDNCIKMVNEYEEIFNNDKLYNIRGIIEIYKSNFEEAEKMLKMAYINDKYDVNVLYNIGYVKELLKDFKEAKNYYIEILNISNDKELILEGSNKIKALNSILNEDLN